ncbi:DUF2513 domain-containing protein [Staphylococcus pseudintermedius]|uniref:DUF2513 domain-containing protein n=1 Tax=Staphylococcus pseudintermedius TaxID=283734 RepID=UPI0018E1D696|nr:DUF2513 domain-containing protein [Staphylococcus pseudintermedius]EGQ2787394.1 DUF2513 domain-containing protein [Staphylococcus pseudintermedius]EGQ3673051.1 DUF2513 domain-containing protein [Staphylococcus pseudintermedius]EGQ3723972.1 DUF2513 domain-containing protein [Staphylococcus pseudintermedius]EIO0096420.1 DUF2513 domain-containing protein [Staphylococcus pseudintermedius]EJM2421448.1 DUF2513 domain-containing protein [Staphylococcus pseudintermedius]
MKLKHDCIREVLLVIESDLNLNNVLDNEDLEHAIKDFSHEDIEYTVKQLAGEGYIDAEFYMDGYFVKHMNFSGHNLLDDVRDVEVWKQTKDKASKISSVSIPVIQHIASSVINKMLGLQ